jgi:chromosome partitioning protein
MQLDGQAKKCNPAIVHNGRRESLQMRTIAITINKGGVGKTTLTKHLATAASGTGHNVIVLDMDTQQNATTWGKWRSQQQNDPLPVVRFLTENDLAEELGRAQGLALIDTPPGRSSEVPAVKNTGSWGFDCATRTAAAARSVLDALDVPMSPIVLHRYEAYRLANPKGLTVQELEPESRAATETAALWEWLSAEVQLSTSAHVHMGAV